MLLAAFTSLWTKIWFPSFPFSYKVVYRTPKIWYFLSLLQLPVWYSSFVTSIRFLCGFWSWVPSLAKSWEVLCSLSGSHGTHGHIKVLVATASNGQWHNQSLRLTHLLLWKQSKFLPQALLPLNQLISPSLRPSISPFLRCTTPFLLELQGNPHPVSFKVLKL